MDINILVPTDRYINSAFEQYDKDIRELALTRQSYRELWHDVLTNTYHAKFKYKDDKRYMSIPEHYYTLFLLKYSDQKN
jgi:AAA+ ATPase superfamily predicted ATPase